MPTITLKVTPEQRELWVEAAAHDLISLSEWLRQAATARLGAADKVTWEPTPSAAPSREASHQDPAESPHGPEETSRLEPTVETKLAEARQLLHKEFKPDFKDPPKPKKPRR